MIAAAWIAGAGSRSRVNAAAIPSVAKAISPARMNMPVALRMPSRAGLVTVQALRRQAGELMRPYWTDGGFAFAGVRG